MKALSACAAFVFSLGSALADPAGGKLVYALDLKLNSLDPAKAKTLAEMCAVSQMYDSLMRFDGVNVQPSLARSYSVSDNGRIYTFILRDDVRFNNGDKLKASDVVNSLRRAEHLNWLIDDIFAPNETSVQITLKWSFAPFLRYLAMPQASIISSKSFRPDGRLHRHIGTGAFIYSAQDTSGLELKANERYFLGAPKLAFLQLVNTPDKSKLKQLLKNSSVHILKLSSLDDLPKYAQLTSASGLNSTVMVFNTKNAALGSLTIRKAIMMGIDKSQLVDTSSEQAEEIFTPQMLGYNYAYKGVEHDLQMAKKMLKQSGIIKEFSLIIAVLDDANLPTTKAIAENIAEQLQQLNIKASVRTFALNEPLEGDIFILGFDSMHADSDDFMQLLLRQNPSAYESKHLNKLIKAARFSVNKKERIEYYQAAQDLIESSAVWQPLVHKKYLYAHASFIKGFKPSSLIWGCDFKSVSLK